ncbi:unnamed protein product, partial [Nesidiocoris tenuis]
MRPAANTSGRPFDRGGRLRPRSQKAITGVSEEPPIPRCPGAALGLGSKARISRAIQPGVTR